ncbi:hypothetical protein AA21291_2212 [Swaminathania salitolerans LMG 21291]|nr:hypothetical protein AA21291_2212 [Swaminathania salitolerans LMG 21291]
MVVFPAPIRPTSTMIPFGAIPLGAEEMAATDPGRGSGKSDMVRFQSVRMVA